MQLKHWQTTALGVLVILGTLAHSATLYLAHQPLDTATLFAGLAAGFGLVRSPDASKVDAAIKQLTQGEK